MVDKHFYEGNGDIIYRGGICFKMDFDNEGEYAIISDEFETDDSIGLEKIWFLINEDKVGHLMTENYETLSEKEWAIFWSKVKNEQITILDRVCWVSYRSKHINIFEKYSIDELKKIYENKNIWAVTEYFVLFQKKYNDHAIIRYRKNKKKVLLDLAIKISNIDDCIKKGCYKSNKETGLAIMHSNAYKYIRNLLKEDDNNHSDMYDFVINNLQYASIEDLEELSKLNPNHFLLKGKGRTSRNKKIFKYDLNHNLLNTYINRNACMDAEQISKQALYNVLSGKRKTLNGFIYEEEQ